MSYFTSFLYSKNQDVKNEDVVKNVVENEVKDEKDYVEVENEVKNVVENDKVKLFEINTFKFLMKELKSFEISTLKKVKVENKVKFLMQELKLFEINTLKKTIVENKEKILGPQTQEFLKVRNNIFNKNKVDKVNKAKEDINKTQEFPRPKGLDNILKLRKIDDLTSYIMMRLRMSVLNKTNEYVDEINEKCIYISQNSNDDYNEIIFEIISISFDIRYLKFQTASERVERLISLWHDI